MSSSYAPTGDRLVSRGTLALLVGTVVNGLSAYAFIVIGTRAIGAQAFAPILILWTLWSICVATLTIPVQHWIVRVVRADEDETSLRRSTPALAGVAVAAGMATVVVTWSARSVLFHQDSLLLPVLAGCIPIGALAVGFLRGVLVARDRLVAAAAAMAGENVVRVVVAAVVAARGGSVVWYAFALVAGFGVAFLWPQVFVVRTLTSEPAESRDVHPLAFLAGIVGGSLLAQFILTGGPLMLDLVGGSTEQITALFAALSLFGAPYLMALGVAPQLTKTLTGMTVDGREASLHRVRQVIMATALVGGAAGGLFAAIAGPALVQGLFGSDVLLPSAAYAGIGVGSVLGLTTLAETLVLVAHGWGRSVAWSWVVATIAFVATALVPVGDAAVRVTIAFAAAEMMALVVLFVAEYRQVGRTVLATSDGPGRTHREHRVARDRPVGHQAEVDLTRPDDRPPREKSRRVDGPAG